MLGIDDKIKYNFDMLILNNVFLNKYLIFYFCDNVVMMAIGKYW